MFFRFYLITTLLACTTYAIQVKPFYGPAQHLPHREYGVPQQIPFREYVTPASKYGPPKLNIIGGGGSSSGLYEEIKNYYGAPKPFYGPPHKFEQQFGSPSKQYGPPAKPAGKFGPPPLKPASSYGLPPPQALPLFQPAPQFKPNHQPASSYGPPPSGPLNIPPKQIFGPPPPNYGPPPLPNFNQKPETTIILTAGQNTKGHHHQQEQVQIQIDATGHTHSIAGSQAPFQTACDGWKPIPSPAGSYVENNHIETQTGYSQVSQAQAHALQSPLSSSRYNGEASGGVNALGSTVFLGDSGTGANSIIDGLSDEQLVAVALQSSTFDAGNSAHQNDNLPPTGQAGDFNKHGLNEIEAEALQISLGSIDDSYSKPPEDSFRPGTEYSKQHQSNFYSSQSGFAASGPGGNFGRPPSPNIMYGSPPPLKGNYRSPPLTHTENYGSPPKNNYFPSPPNGNYGLAPPGAPPSVQGVSTFAHHQAQASLGIQYGKQSGNLGPFPPHSGVQPNKPVAYRPPVPPGLFENIGATVQHLDKFGVKPQLQAPTYIPPATYEIPQSGPSNLDIQYGAPHQQQQQGIPQHIIEQQLPQPRPPNGFVHTEQQINSQQQQFGNTYSEYGVPSVQPKGQQVPPQTHYLPPSPSAEFQKQYITHTGYRKQNINNDLSYRESATNSFDNTAIASNHFNQESMRIQALPLQQEQPRFHDCGHGPNLFLGGSYNYQQQKEPQYSINSGSSISQSTPVAEQHTKFITSPASSYGPPPSGGNDLDHVGYASETSQVTALASGSKPENLPGLDGINVLSAQKSHATHFSTQELRNGESYQIHFGSGDQQQTANHEEILSAELLQTILNAVEQPQQQPLPANHKVESRSDIYINEELVENEDEGDNEPGVTVQESKNVEIEVRPDVEKLLETDASVQEIKPIVVKE